MKKEKLRRVLLKKMLSLTEKEVKEKSKKIQKNLEKLSLYKKAKKVMIYYPLKGEVNLLDMVRKAKKDFCFPKIEGKNLVPYLVEDLEKDFKKGKFGVKEPIEERCKRIKEENLDLVIVPGLAFDYQKNRLGRGAGFYDRFLKKVKKPKIGVAFNFQVLESLPYLSHDEKIDILVTETEIF